MSKDVLIPRPETEAIIDLTLSLAGKPFLPGVVAPAARLSKHPKILDVGTGSGCIAITLKLELPGADVYACDISEKAIEVARRNAEKMGAEVSFRKSDLLDIFEKSEKFDLIVANLPYVSRKWDWLDEPESAGLKYEPDIALFAENDGLEIIFRLLEQAKGRTKFLIIEADPSQHDAIVHEAEKNGFELDRISGFQLLFGSR